MIKFKDEKLTKEYHLMLERERTARYGYDKIKNCMEEAYNILDLLNQFKGEIRFRVNISTLETLVIDDSMEYLEYEFRGFLMDLNNYKVGTGYYSRLYGKKRDARIGRRKLYQSSKGYYFMESGYRRYISEYIKL